MSGKIPREFIDELLARTDIVELIDARVPLTKGGRDFKACCPFHNEKTPSFTVSQTKQFYHCFGCSANGSAIGFLMEFEHLSFREAIEELAQSAGLEIPDTGPARAEDTLTPALLDALADANRFFKEQLRHHEMSAEAVRYLKERGLSGEIAAGFELGLAPPGWDSLSQTAQGDNKILDLMAKAGLVARKDNGQFYDRFRSRVIFPIHDYKGRVVAFGGRILGDGEPKYLNSPETPVFQKRSELYNLPPRPLKHCAAGSFNRGRGLYGCGRAGTAWHRARRCSTGYSNHFQASRKTVSPRTLNYFLLRRRSCGANCCMAST